MQVMETELTTIPGNGRKIIARTAAGRILRSGGQITVYFLFSERERVAWAKCLKARSATREGIRLAYHGAGRSYPFDVSATFPAVAAWKLFERDDFDAVVTLTEDWLVRLLRR